jgi:hypothetical protein
MQALPSGRLTSTSCAIPLGTRTGDVWHSIEPSARRIEAGSELEARVCVTNTGRLDGDEVVQPGQRLLARATGDTAQLILLLARRKPGLLQNVDY